jgi:molybdopterin-guanine dinucleotide biosynthesis protein MobB
MITELSRVRDHIDREPRLADLILHIDTNIVDLIIVEGFRDEVIPKIEIYRSSLKQPLLADSDKNVIAIASDTGVTIQTPVLDLNNPAEIAAFILEWLKTRHSDIKLIPSPPVSIL